MRWGSPIAIALFAIALGAAGIALGRWWWILSRASSGLRRAGAQTRAELMDQLVRRLVLWGVGTVLFTSTLWWAVCHDLSR